MTRVLVITHDLVGPLMAGPAIRCFELSRVLAQTCDVTLASLLPLGGELEAPFKVTSFLDDPVRLAELGREADVIVLQGLMHRRFPLLTRLGKRLVMDLYDPFLFESYPHLLEEADGGRENFLSFWDTQNEQMDLADFSICASERQRDMFLGRYCALGRLTPGMFAEDPSFRRLLDVVPFGLGEAPVRHDRPVIKGVVPGIGLEDKVLLWGGGIWNWFDPLTVIQAIARLSETRSDIKLYFLGVKHPNPEIPAMEMTNRAVALSDELGLTGRHVFFNHGWVPYDERQNYLAEADIGISSHFDAIETRFSFRTRVLDYLWAGLPIISTEGDSMSELVARQELGAVTGYRDVEGWIAAIASLVDDPERLAATRERVREAAVAFHWAKVAEPLVRYCQAPYANPAAFWSVPRAYARSAPRRNELLSKILRTLRTDGLGVVARKGLRFVRKRLVRTTSPS